MRNIIKELFRKTKISKAINDKYPNDLFVLSLQDSNDVLNELISSGNPFFCGRLGRSEAWGAVYQKYKEINPFLNFPDEVNKLLSINAGMFSTSFIGRHYYMKTLHKCLKQCSAYSMMMFPNENYLVGKYCKKNIPLFNVDVLDVSHLYYCNTPWTLSLKNKKVLIVTSNDLTIKKQYEIKDKLFDKEMFPDCKLIVYKAPITYAGSKPKYKTWKKTVKAACHDISTIDFDIALLACGSYGMPLGAYIFKKMNKQSIYVGAILSFMFGIKTKRDELENRSVFYNKYWVRPSSEETPENKDLIEDGCYW